MRHRHAVKEDRNFPRTGEGHRNVRPSVARALLTTDFDREPVVVPTDADLWEAERVVVETCELYAQDAEGACCDECAEMGRDPELAAALERLRVEAWGVEAAYWG